MPGDPSYCGLVYPRPSAAHVIRVRDVEGIQAIRHAVDADNLHILRYDPANNLQPYNPDKEPIYDRRRNI